MPTKAQTTAAVARLAELRASMKQHKIDGLVITDLSSIRYLFGYSGSMGMAIVGKKSVHFFTNDLYAVQVHQETYKHDGMVIHIDRDFWGTAAKNKLASKMTSIGFDPSHTNMAAFKSMKKGLAGAKLVEVPDLVSPISQIKTKSEIASITTAAQIVSEAYEQMLGMVKPGMTEHEVATFLASKTRELGSERDAFDIIVVAGKRSAMPHGRATKTAIKKGDVVTVDFGACVDGLYSDMTRTFCVGTPTKKIVDVFAVLYDAHLSALDAAKAGISAADLDRAARGVIELAGYGEYFRHSLGHGLGYEVHEHPRVSYANKNGVIKEGTVITIEPGIYLPNAFGMRIEDDVVIRKNGCDILTTAPRELVVV